ncbi:hypothetical protein F5X68DRAFT_261711 [Plectosphaerella plurivora]|uniref:Uncharacterized protein n=1 Tax=Plectosphaerella plurivora TaxID=936078 RepID=A0A9P8VC09_9PEZI|nr:hypothetical protein F5X68DRAFT_261711 [Plectosphaerella plurivora]
MSSYRSFIANLKDKLRARNKESENLIVRTVLPPQEFSQPLTWTVDQLRHLFQIFLNQAVAANPEMFHPQDIQELTKRFAEMKTIKNFAAPGSPWTYSRVPGYKRWLTDGKTWVSAMETMIELIPRGCPIPPTFEMERSYRGYLQAWRDIIAVPNGLPPLLIPKERMQTLVSNKRKAEEEDEPAVEQRPEKVVRLNELPDEMPDELPDKPIKQEVEHEDDDIWTEQPESASNIPRPRAESGRPRELTPPAEPAISTQNVPLWAAQTLIKARSILPQDINPETESAESAILRRNTTEAFDCVIMEVAKLFNRQYVASSTTTSGTGNPVEAGHGERSTTELVDDRFMASSPSILEDRPAQTKTYNRATTYDDDLSAAQINPKPRNFASNPTSQQLSSAGSSGNRGKSVPATINSKISHRQISDPDGILSTPKTASHSKPQQSRKSSTPSVIPKTPSSKRPC